MIDRSMIARRLIDGARKWIDSWRDWELALSCKPRFFLSFGGGVNSVALQLLLEAAGAEIGPGKQIESVFADHGTDWPETYDYLAKFRERHAVEIVKPRHCGHDNLAEYCYAKSVVPAMRRRWCTYRFKLEPLQRHFAASAERPVVVLLGIAADERRRAKASRFSYCCNDYPLVEIGAGRAECELLIEQLGHPVPPKSGCWLCPFQRRQQWLDLRARHPDLFRRAVELEQRNMDYQTSKGKRPLSLRPDGTTLLQIDDPRQLDLLPELRCTQCLL